MSANKKVNILNLVRQVSVIGIVALGEMLVILTGGIDLGVGSIVGFTGVVAAALQRDNAGLLPTLVVPLLLGSIVFNFLVGRALHARVEDGNTSAREGGRRSLLIAG